MPNLTFHSKKFLFSADERTAQADHLVVVAGDEQEMLMDSTAPEPRKADPTVEKRLQQKTSTR